MNINLRNIDPQYIEVIDKKIKKLSEQTGKKWNRSDYLLMLIRENCELDLIEYRKSEFDIAVEKMLVANENMTKEIASLTEIYEMLFNLLIERTR